MPFVVETLATQRRTDDVCRKMDDWGDKLDIDVYI